MKKLSQLLISISLLFSLGSCGLIELDEDIVDIADMKLDPTSAYLMVGDTLDINPVFTPDSVSFGEVYFTMDNDTVLVKDDEGRLIANTVGTTTVTGISVSLHKTDSCHVSVIPRWEFDSRDYAHSMVVYADIDLGTRAFDPSTMMVSAWMGDELRGLGVVKEFAGIKYVLFRIYGNNDVYDEEMPERVTFKLYDSKKFSLRTFQQRLDFDGQSHGTLSNLFRLTLMQ